MTTGFYFDGAARVEYSAYRRRSGQVAFDTCRHRNGSRQTICVERQAQRAGDAGARSYFDTRFDSEVYIGANPVCDMHTKDIRRGPPA